jgi:hypothetical protein
MRFTAFIAAALLAVWGCGTDRKGFGEECITSWECETGLCVALPFYDSSKVCTRSCSDSVDCPDGWVCSVFQSCVLFCAPPCGEPPHEIAPLSGFACVNRVPTPCYLVPDGTYCDFCPCPEGAVCDTGTSPPTCVPE